MTRISKLALLASASCFDLSSISIDAFILLPDVVQPATNSQSRNHLLSTSCTPRTTTSSKCTLFLSSTDSDQKSSSSSSSSSTSKLSHLPESCVELTLLVPPTATSAAYSKTLSTVSKQLSIPGFRKGAKIPPQVIENSWTGGKKSLRTMAINELCSELIAPALKDRYELEPIGQPTLVEGVEKLAEKFVPGEELEIVVRCDVWPEIRWKEVEAEKPYVGLKGKYNRKPFNQARFDAALRDLKERYAELVPYQEGDDHALEMGDACMVNMVGYMATDSGEKGDPLPEAASGDNVEVILGEGRYMEGLVEGLLGGKVGDTQTVRVTFPPALKNKDLAGKPALFDVTILSASKRILPTLTDEFAAKVRPNLTAESLKEELRKAVDSQDSMQYLDVRNEALAKALADVLEVQVPDTLVTNQAREKYALMMTDMRDNGMADEEIKKLISPENFLKYKELSKEGIVRDFKVSMALDEIARVENIVVPTYQVEEQMQSLKDQAVKEGQKVEDMNEEEMRRKVETTLERRMVYDFLAENAVLEVEYVDEEQERFDEAMMDKLAEESLKREEEEGAAGGVGGRA